MGCPHEKHIDGSPGVTIVVIPQDGQATCATPDGDGARYAAACAAACAGGCAGWASSGATAGVAAPGGAARYGDAGAAP